MQILVIAATKSEIGDFMVNGRDIEVLITGVGVPGTLYNLQKKLHLRKPGIVIQAGIAGSYSNAIELGEVVLVREDTFADIGIEEKESFKSIFQTGFADKDSFPFSNGWLINPNSIFSSSSLPITKSITVNKVSDSLLQKRQFLKNFSPDLETMEGAALHYVCLQEKMPFIQIRSISNFVGERDKNKWKLKDSVTNLSKELYALINLLLDK